MNFLPHTLSFWIILCSVLMAGFFSYTSGKLTLPASLTGVIVALLMYMGAGLLTLIMLAVFFILGTAATSYKKGYKQKMGLAEVHEGQRRSGQVLANAGVAAILALINLLTESNRFVIEVMISASFASAIGDTLSSELGNVYGRNFYNILTLKKDQRGLNGVISLEGTLFGISGSMVIAFIYIVASAFNYAFVLIVTAGVAGNLCDSLLGALFERKGWLGNDAVNFLSTAFAALLALLLLQLQ
jgi:uncharacterized protein (TIGR00297 family)